MSRPLIFLCSAVGILVHHVLHIWETQLSEGRRSPDHWEILFLVGRLLGAFVTPSALSRWRSTSSDGLRVQCHLGPLPRRSQHSRTVLTKVIDATGSPTCSAVTAAMFSLPCTAALAVPKAKLPQGARGQSTLEAIYDKRWSLMLILGPASGDIQ